MKKIVDITTDLTDIKKRLRECYENLIAITSAMNPTFERHSMES